jgi:PAT family beta-lactamase induction signal transducer AmpG
MGTMANPFYIDLGFSIAEIANIASAFGLAMTLAGAALGGLLVVRFGIMPVLLFTVVMAPATNLIFSWLAVTGATRTGLVIAIIADNVTSGMAYPVLIAYISSLTSRAYTATQYALLSSLMTLPGQLIGGFTGVLAERVGWFWFFICATGLGLPAIALAIVLARRAQGSSPASR